jgi:exodeoxyribonuclease-3
VRIVTFNANGIRSAERKGFFKWFARQRADVLCVQELKAQAHQIEGPEFHVRGFHRYLFPAQKPGYSGVAIYTVTVTANSMPKVDTSRYGLLTWQ